MAPTPRAAVVEIVVADMAASLAFYRRLGLEPEGGDDEVHVEMAFGPLRLALDTEASIAAYDPSFTPPPNRSRVALAFACSTPDEVDAVYADLVGAGYSGHLEPFDAPWGMRYATVHDPDGVGVDLFALRARE